jgi:hypothetical protein
MEATNTQTKGNKMTTKTTNKKYYAWVGQNATCGTPNTITGNYSMYGTDYVFNDKQSRDQFVDDYYDPNGNNWAEKCTKQQLRNKNLGSAVRDWEMDLLCAEDETPVFDEQDGWA